MCHSSDCVDGRTHPDPRKPSKRAASAEPARIHATISSWCPGLTVRVIETVTGEVMRRSSGGAAEPRKSGWHSVAMPESAAEIHARAVAAASGGHLPAPTMTGWEIFPWEVVEGAIAPKTLDAPGVEQPRPGDEGGAPCDACAG